MRKTLKSASALILSALIITMSFLGVFIGFSVVALTDDGFTAFGIVNLPNRNYNYYSTLYGDCLNVGDAEDGGYHIVWNNGSTNHRVPVETKLDLNNFTLKFNNFKVNSGTRARFAILMGNNSSFQYSMYGDSCVIVLDATEGKLYAVKHGGGNPNANVWVPIITDNALLYENIKEKEFFLDFAVISNGTCGVTVSYSDVAVSGIIPDSVFDFISDTRAVNLQFSSMENGTNENAKVNQQLDVIGYKYAPVEALNKRIAALPQTITANDIAVVTLCEQVYNSLSDTDKAQITNYAKLQSAIEQASQFSDNTGWTTLDESHLTASLAYLNGPDRWPDNFIMSVADNGGFNLKWTNGSTNHRIVLANPLSLNKLQLKFSNYVRTSGTHARLAIYLWNSVNKQYSMYGDSCVLILDAAAGTLYTVKYGGGSPNANIWTPILTDNFLKYDNIKERDIIFEFEPLEDGTCKVTISLNKNDSVSAVIPSDVFDHLSDTENVFIQVSAMENGTNENAKVTQDIDFVGYKKYVPSLADEIIEKIDALPDPITPADYSQVKVYDALYKALSSDDKLKVKNYAKLQAAVDVVNAAKDNEGYTIITGNADLCQSLEGFNSMWSEFAVERVPDDGVRMKWTASPSNRRIGTNTKYPLDGLNLKFDRLVKLSGKASKFAIFLNDSMNVQYSRYKKILAYVFDFEVGKLYKVDFNTVSNENKLTEVISDSRLLYDNIAGKEFVVSFDKRTDGAYDMSVTIENGEAIKTIIPSADISELSDAENGTYFTFSSFTEDLCTQVLDYVGYKYVYKSQPDSEVQAIIDGINSLPNKPGVSDGDKIRALKAAYDNLQDYQSIRVSNYDKLETAIGIYSQALKDESRYDKDGWYIPDLSDCGLLEQAGNDYIPPQMSEIPFNGGLHQYYFYAGYGNSQSINRSFRLDGLTVRFNNFEIMNNNCNGFWFYVQTSTNHIAYWANSWDSAIRGIAFLFGRDDTLYIAGGNAVERQPLITSPLLSQQSLTSNEFTIGFKANGTTFDVIVTVGDNEPLVATIEQTRLDAASILDTEKCYISTVCHYEAGDELFKGAIDVTGIKFVPYSNSEVAEWTAVIDKINKLPVNITAKDEGKLIEALNAYLSLSKIEMREFVTNYSKLTEAFAKLHALQLNQGLDVYTNETVWYTPKEEKEPVINYVYIEEEESVTDGEIVEDNDSSEPEKVLKKRPVWKKVPKKNSDSNMLYWILIPIAAVVLAGVIVLIIVVSRKKSRKG
ncbi:MAG: hypothetical protein IKK24_01680 [Clostridia bacterium]|nr:hypothetical protein [Clostridia bacterium]